MFCLIKEMGEQAHTGNAYNMFSGKKVGFCFRVVAGDTLHLIQLVIEGACWIRSMSSCRTKNAEPYRRELLFHDFDCTRVVHIYVEL